MTRLPLFLLLTSFAVVQNPPTGDPQALALAVKLIARMTIGTTVSDVTATGGTTRIADCSMADMAENTQAEDWEHRGGPICTSNAGAAFRRDLVKKPEVFFLPNRRLGRNSAYALGMPLNGMVAQGIPAGGLHEQSVTVSHFGPGAVLPAELSKSVDARKSEPGDKIEARSTMNLLSQGQIVIPANSRIMGHLTEVKAATEDSPGSKIGIVFDGARLKGGRELPFVAAVQAIGRRLPPVFGVPLPGGAGGASVTSANAGAPGVSPLTLQSEGVVGLPGLTLQSSAKGTVISSSTGNVKLDSGTQLMLRVISN